MISQKSRNLLFAKLGPPAFEALEQAVSLCKHRGHDRIGLAHWLRQMLEQPGSDFSRIIEYFGVDSGRMLAEITGVLDELRSGYATPSGFAPELDEAVRDALLICQAAEQDSIRTGHILLACLQSDRLRPTIMRLSIEFEGIDALKLERKYELITRGSREAAISPASATDDAPAQRKTAADDEADATADGAAPAVFGNQHALGRFSTDMTARAAAGEMDPVVGREAEIGRLIDVLCRRTKNNPILVGDAGVGKTAVVEGLAHRIAMGQVPPKLLGVSLRALDLGLLLAGASMKGEFESRLRQVIDEVQASATPIILFIDEAHTLIGAGGAKGQGDAANLLKPALARGTLRTVAATTHAEYKEFFEQDPALTRRFEKVVVDEPDDATAQRMIRAVARKFEAYHNVIVLEEAIASAVHLSRRYLPSRQLPDKAVGLLDTACSRVAIALSSPPTQLDLVRAAIGSLRDEKSALQREAQHGSAHAPRMTEIDENLAKTQTELDSLETRWKKECDLVRQIGELQNKLSAAPADADGKTPTGGDGRAIDFAALQKLRLELSTVQGEAPLVLAAVDAQAIGAVVSDWTGIPAGRMVKNEVRAILDLSSLLSKRVLGQDHALDLITRRLWTSRTPGLADPNKPVGVFMLAGPSGVGKTETAKALAEAVFGGEQNLITVNMSEYQEAHTVSLLKGAPPGYVGYGKGGILTEAVRRKPYSIVLLDEVEKAHKDVHELFFQIFDAGKLDDSEGRSIDFRNCIILLTSNVGTDMIDLAWSNPETPPDVGLLAKELRHEMAQTFPDALLGRLEIIPYRPIGADLLRQVVRHQLDRVARRVQDTQKVPFTYTDEVIDLIASKCDEPQSGARKIAAVINQQVLPAISKEYLTRTAEGQMFSQVHVCTRESQLEYEFDEELP